MRENYYLDDGTYSASQIIILMVQRALDLDPEPWARAQWDARDHYLDDRTLDLGP